MGVDCDFPNPCDCGCSDDKTREAKLDRDWRNRALDGELALRVLLNRQRTGKPLDLEKYANIAMRSASVLRTDIEGDPDNQAPPAPASEVLEAKERVRDVLDWYDRRIHPPLNATEREAIPAMKALLAALDRDVKP